MHSEGHIFICYSRKDINTIYELYDRLESSGYKPWLDKKDILPGKTWEREIEDAIKNASIILVCLSQAWVEDRSYAHKELRIAIEAMDNLPEDKTYIIPVRLNDCKELPSLQKIQCVNLYDKNGFEKLLAALEDALGDTIPDKPKTELETILELFGPSIEIIYIDPWETVSSEPDERFLKEYYKEGKTLSHSFDLIDQKNFEEVLKLWKPLDGNKFFRLDRPEWKSSPYILCHIHSAKMDIFASHVHLGQKAIGDETAYKFHFRCAYFLLHEIIQVPPYNTHMGPSGERFTIEIARARNKDYRDVILLGTNWINFWSIKILASMCEVDKDEFENTYWKLKNREKVLTLILEGVEK